MGLPSKVGEETVGTKPSFCQGHMQLQGKPGILPASHHLGLDLELDFPSSLATLTQLACPVLGSESCLCSEVLPKSQPPLCILPKARKEGVRLGVVGWGGGQ